MTVRDSSLRAAAALVVCAGALLVAGCGGGNGSGKVLGGSNNTSVCQYTKRFGKGRVYVEIAVSPVSLEPTACSAFNRTFGGRSFGGSPTLLPSGTGPQLPPVQAATLGVWSAGDQYLTEQAMIRSADRVRGPWRYFRIEDASHWIPLDQPDMLNALLLDFLGG